MKIKQHILFSNKIRPLKNNFIFALCFLLFLGCSDNETKTAKQIIKFLPNDENTYNAYLVIPGAGCGGCISNAEQIMRQNIDRKNIRFVLTKIESLKVTNLKTGKKLLSSENVFIDIEDKIPGMFGKKDLIYPFIIYIEGNTVKEVNELNPVNPENTDKFKNFIKKTPCHVIDIEKFLSEQNSSEFDLRKLEVMKYKLDVPKNNPIGIVIDFKYSKERTFILDAAQRIFIHDNNGNLLNYINKKGNGPEEYNNAAFFDIDTLNKRIFLLDFSTKKIQVYDFRGNFLKTIKAPYSPLNFCYLENNKFLLSVPDYNQEEKEKFELMIVNENGKILSKIKPFQNIERKSKVDLFNAPMIKKEKNYILYWTTNTDIIYRINDDYTVGIHCIFKQGKLLIPKKVSEDLELYNQNLGKYIYQINAVETEAYHFVKFFFGMKYYGIILDKATSRFYKISEGRGQQIGRASCRATV